MDPPLLNVQLGRFSTPVLELAWRDLKQFMRVREKLHCFKRTLIDLCESLMGEGGGVTYMTDSAPIVNTDTRLGVQKGATLEPALLNLL